MCGIAGIFNIRKDQPVPRVVLENMVEVLHHRGPDDTSIYTDQHIGMGFKRLSIVDISGGRQPFFSPDKGIVSVCNGEIFNHKELRSELRSKGYTFTSHCDVEVLIPLYQEYGIERMFDKIVGQFSFAIFDKNQEALYLARDHFGVCPLFYTEQQGHLLFGSEIKALLQVPFVPRKVNLTGLDQVFSFPGTVSPHTLFQGIHSLKPGHYVKHRNNATSIHCYWDADYPLQGDYDYGKNERYYAEKLEEKLLESVNYRLNADVPVGFYLSGGLDSSLIGSLMRTLRPQAAFKSFSVTFPHRENSQIDESIHQQRMATYLHSNHHEIAFDWKNISNRLRDIVYYGETAVKESYNTCSLALSAHVRSQGIKVVLSGEGADELCGGYIGYRLDALGNRNLNDQMDELDLMLEAQMRQQLWGDPSFFYEKHQVDFRSVKQNLYSNAVNDIFYEFDCLHKSPVDLQRLMGRHPFHKRSYLDLKLRLADHLISDHCDRVCFANSVEGRYPFLDVGLFEFLKTVPPEIQLKKLVEKYLLKQVAGKYVPEEIVNRQKFGFVAPGSCQLLQNKDELTLDMLSYERIKRQGFFNPDVIEKLKEIYSQPGFKINAPYDSDLLIVVITFNLLLDVFEMENFTSAPITKSTLA
ncbi:asparagine synthase (glutamine-hydrolyzing) [Rapidithrix thailandica]|uniref:asparagine synthase (glutamine-hydrolyzing) n=1 Tax=Rapidithrix thailandica TaxID=413964 RepID=A0AAW9S3C4_9BACT